MRLGAPAGLLALRAPTTASTSVSRATPFCWARVAGEVPALRAVFSSSTVMPSVDAMAWPTAVRVALARCTFEPGTWSAILPARAVIWASVRVGAFAGLLAFSAAAMASTSVSRLTPFSWASVVSDFPAVRAVFSAASSTFSVAFTAAVTAAFTAAGAWWPPRACWAPIDWPPLSWAVALDTASPVAPPARMLPARMRLVNLRVRTFIANSSGWVVWAEASRPSGRAG